MQYSFAKRNAIGAILIMLILLSMSCASIKYLKTETVKEANISGTVTLYFYEEFYYGGVAIIDVEGDDYTFEILASQYNYSVKNNLTADQAMDEAAKFIATWNKQMKIILDDSGTIIGYEIRPLFQISRHGTSDIFDIKYIPSGDKIRVAVDLKSNVKKNYEYDLYRGGS
ncbi:MAG: hypothetical protein AMK71_07890 [Nitrospira bacterium SG8_35_4]|nr:MAG: hypothetical protein AMK71_07890 [Nitrospira bacterium SG8_35_4]